MEAYIGKRMQELLHQKGVTRAEFRRALNNLDDRIAKNYLAGGDLTISKLLLIAEYFGVSVMEFFERDGVRMDRLFANAAEDSIELVQPQVTATAEALLHSERIEHEKELRHMEETMRLRIEYERKLAALERENTILREQLSKREDTPPHHPAAYVERVNSESSYSGKAAEDGLEL